MEEMNKTREGQHRDRIVAAIGALYHAAGLTTDDILNQPVPA
jgi:hypothetical protein